MTDFPRLIEHAFPLKQASLDSVHEKNVRHGHISTLHIWPARRPLAACRAALIATLLPDPGTPEGRKQLCEKIGGRIVKRIEKKKMPGGQVVERVKEETVGGILHWGRETENAETLNWFRQEIRKAYGGRAPKVLDPFAGGGAIPLEAMRLGCEATAVDINPVAWFILKCTLEYPQKLAGQTRPLPEFILRDDVFMEEFFKRAKGYSSAQIKSALKRLHQRLSGNKPAKASEGQEVFDFGALADELQADLAWHVRAWGRWVLDRARRELAKYYPTYADFEPIKKDHVPYERQPMRLVPPKKEDGTPDIESLNSEFTPKYLEDKRNPRWVAKPTVAYLWARTVTCKNCRATVPMLKTRWLCKKASKRVLLTMQPNADRTGVVFGVETNVPVKGGNAAQKREHDKRLGAGTMSRAGAQCPCCGTIMTMEDLRAEGMADRRGSMMTAVVVDGPDGKEYRLPTEHERTVALLDEEQVQRAFADVPFGVPDEPLVRFGVQGGSYGFPIVVHGFDKWRKLFTSRQLTALGRFVSATRAAREEMAAQQLPPDWIEAVGAYLALVIDKVADYNSTVCVWHLSRELIGHTFTRFALPITWDFSEIPTTNNTGGAYSAQLDWSSRYIDHALIAGKDSELPRPINRSAMSIHDGTLDAIITDPPYYDAIPYSDLMDFFYIWLRRSLHGVSSSIDTAFAQTLSPKWNHEANDGELIDDCSRHGNDAALSKRIYEDGMAHVFSSCCTALKPEGRLVVVFANKQPDAWETLVSAIIRAGFVVDGSWPIQTEMSTRMRAKTSAALASSVWLAARKRPATARPGWDNRVLEEMRANIAVQLREFWDAGIRGPDFVWAATGPALEAYSKHPVVRKANEPNATMGVGEFLNHVRRMVVDYIVGQVLSGEKGADLAAADRLDEVTAYYLLHRHDFGMEEAPVGACILYATACGLSDAELERSWDILVGAGGGDASADDLGDDDDAGDEDGEADADAGAEGGGSKVKLKTWSQRRGKSMGYEAPEGKAVPLIDRVHRLMHLWKDGDLHKVDEYIDEHSLRRNELFKRVVQSLIELSTNSERSLLESISNHIGAKGAVPDRGPELFTTKAGGDRE
jgi:adenine-specific DNA methylase